MKKILAAGIVLVSLAVSSCWYNHKWEDLHPNGQSSTPLSGGGCSDTAGIVMSYSTHIAPFMQTNCSLTLLACHKAGSSFGGDLTTYANVAAYCSGSPSTMMSDITHAGNPMPKGQTKLPDCEIAKMAKWIQNGFPNN